MRTSYNLLKKFVKVDLEPEKLAEILTMRTAEVEETEKLGKGLEDVVVGEILEIKKHPNADRLNLARIDVGSKVLKVVFGAKLKVEVGEKVPVAVAPTKLPTGIEVNPAKLRGEDSEGMISVDSELGIPETDRGLTIFKQTTKNGTLFTEATGLNDTVLEIDILPNRPDLMSHIGLAGEIAALTGAQTDFKTFGKVGYEKIKTASGGAVNFKIQAKEDVVRYIGMEIDGIEISESPLWLKKVLIALDIRPVNNLVDLTNYILAETGQPLHAFDADKLTGNKIAVRRAVAGEKITTLDDKERILNEHVLVIADGENPVAIAGIMGSKNSEVSNKTKRIVLESAIFNPQQVRRATQVINLKTDASRRFERGIDHDQPYMATARFIELLLQITPDDKKADLKFGKLFDSKPQGPISQVIPLSLERVFTYLGENIKIAEVVQILTRIGCSVSVPKKLNGDLQVMPPSFRLDLKRSVDLIEELARIRGLENIPITLPRLTLSPHLPNQKMQWEIEAKEALRSVDFTEVKTYSFVWQDVFEALNLDPQIHLELENPISQKQKYLRASLLPNMLRTVRENLKHHDEFRIFEIGNIYAPLQREELPDQSLHMVGLIVGDVDEKKAGQLFYESNGALESVLDRLGIPSDKLIYTDIAKLNPTYHEERTALLTIKGEEIGYIGEIHPQVLNKLGINARVAFFDIQFEKLIKIATFKHSYSPLPKYPAVEIDIAVSVPEKTLVQDIERSIRKAGGQLLREVTLFDQYQDQELKKQQRRSLAFRMVFRSDRGTLKEKEINKIQERVLEAIKKVPGAEIRL